MEGRYTMANINVTIRMDEKLKLQSEELFKDLGLSLSAAFIYLLNKQLENNAYHLKLNVM